MATIKDSKTRRVQETRRALYKTLSKEGSIASHGGEGEGLSSREMGQEARLGVIPNQSGGEGRNRER